MLTVSADPQMIEASDISVLMDARDREGGYN